MLESGASPEEIAKVMVEQKLLQAIGTSPGIILSLKFKYSEGLKSKLVQFSDTSIPSSSWTVQYPDNVCKTDPPICQD